MKKRRIVITRETDELLVVRAPARSGKAWCPECAAHVWMLAPEAATAVTGLSARAIYRLVEAGQIHFTETPDGLLLVCPDSFALTHLRPLTKEFSS